MPLLGISCWTVSVRLGRSALGCPAERFSAVGLGPPGVISVGISAVGDARSNWDSIWGDCKGEFLGFAPRPRQSGGCHVRACTPDVPSYIAGNTAASRGLMRQATLPECVPT